MDGSEDLRRSFKILPSRVMNEDYDLKASCIGPFRN